MSDIAGKMAEWRKTVWGTGPCPDSSQENFTLTDEERAAIESCVADDEAATAYERAATLRGLLERTPPA
jgi:hypothetical protein